MKEKKQGSPCPICFSHPLNILFFFNVNSAEYLSFHSDFKNPYLQDWWMCVGSWTTRDTIYWKIMAQVKMVIISSSVSPSEVLPTFCLSSKWTNGTGVFLVLLYYNNFLIIKLQGGKDNHWTSTNIYSLDNVRKENTALEASLAHLTMWAIFNSLGSW